MYLYFDMLIFVTFIVTMLKVYITDSLFEIMYFINIVGAAISCLKIIMQERIFTIDVH